MDNVNEDTNRLLFKANQIANIGDITACIVFVIYLEYFWVSERIKQYPYLLKGKLCETTISRVAWEDYRQMLHNYGYIIFNINLDIKISTSLLTAQIFLFPVLYLADSIYNSFEQKIICSCTKYPWEQQKQQLDKKLLSSENIWEGFLNIKVLVHHES